MEVEILEAFAECHDIKGTLALVGRRNGSADAKLAEMRAELSLKVHQIEELDAQCVEMRGTLAPIGRRIEETESEIVDVTVSLALRTRQLAESTVERNGIRADLALRTQQLAESTVERNGVRADLALRTQQLAESTVERNGVRADLTLRTQQLAESTAERNGVGADLAIRTQQLAASTAEIERFAYITAHDLQEPVRTVVSFSQLLQRHLGDGLNAESRDYLDFIISGARRMGDQVRALLSYLLTSRDQSIPVAVVLDSVVDNARDNLRGMIDERGAHFEIGPLPTVAGNRVLLTELFQNLIANAIKYTPADSPPRIDISAHRDGHFWRLAVRDEGIGIAPDHHQRIFEIFERLNPDLPYPGVGIGLTACKSIVERLGGRIWVESEEGHGSTFLFTLPDGSAVT